VKNCGHRFQVLVATQEFVEGVLVRSILPKYNPPTVLHDRVLSLIQVCVFQKLYELSHFKMWRTGTLKIILNLFMVKLQLIVSVLVWYLSYWWPYLAVWRCHEHFYETVWGCVEVPWLIGSTSVPLCYVYGHVQQCYLECTLCSKQLVCYCLLEGMIRLYRLKIEWK